MARPRPSFARAWPRLCAVALLAISATSAGEGAFDPAPWIADLQQVRAAMIEKYANFEWVIFERRMPLAQLFAATEERLRAASSDEEARRVIDRALLSIGDGHLLIRWPKSSDAAPSDPSPASFCRALGYEATMRGQALGPAIPGYRPLADDTAAEFPAGSVRIEGATVGVLRIGMFAPQGYPELCESARAALGIDEHASCDAHCAEQLEGAVYELMGQAIVHRIRQLAAAGSAVLLVDITGNGGGSEWAEAAARMVSPLSLRSERREGVRGAHWADYWGSLSAQLRRAAQAAPAAEAAQLGDWARQVDQAQAQAATPCTSVPFWSGRRPPCKWLAPAFYATGILAEADAQGLRGKPWGALVFSPAQYDFEASVWHGPVVVLVDPGTASAAEQFAAVLQDNKAAVVMGTRTFGAGCGHTRGGTPTVLTHSGGILGMPDCARLRADDSNEVHGIDPDIPVWLQATDDPGYAGRQVATVLARGVEVSVALCAQRHCR